MSGQKIATPVKVALVAWSGDASRLVVEAIPINSGPIIAALVRLLNEGATPP